MIVPDGQGERILSGAALIRKVAWLLGPVGMIQAGRAWLRRSRREKARGGWSTAPEVQLRAYSPSSPADAAAFAGEALLLPDAVQHGLRPDRVIQWYNMHGAFQTASYWKHGDAGSLVLEQVHRPSALPEIGGVTPETVDLGNGTHAQCYMLPASNDRVAAMTLIIATGEQRWLALRATGIERDMVLAIAQGCAPRSG
jgi:hypothetical protein